MRLACWLPLALAGCLVPDRVVDDYLDRDDDGVRTDQYEGGRDCDDSRADVGPDAVERCDGIDNDCDGRIDEDDPEPQQWRDADGDGFGDPDSPSFACASIPAHTSNADDCDDADPRTHPDAPEVCGDGRDNDCDTTIDEDGEPLLWFSDGDGDGHGVAGDPEVSCAAVPGRAPSDRDCDDTDDGIHPDAVDEAYDGVDADCDDADDYDLDGDGHRHVSAPGVTEPDCDDRDATVHPGADDAWYDGVDSDCRGNDDYDADEDGWASDAHGGLDCDDTQRGVRPGVPDPPYDGLDADCDPANDDDADLDGVDGGPNGTDCDDDDPNNHASCDACVDADGDGAFAGCDAYVTLVEDCDDADATISPDAFERFADGIDQDCDGVDLDYAHPAALFVAPSGVDTANCGSLAQPCATPGYAATLAQPSGRVLFVAGGSYPGFETHVDVYGGFDPTFTTRTAVTEVVATSNVPPGSTGIRLQDAGLDGLVVAGDAGAGAAAVRANGRTWLREVRVSLHRGTGTCVGVELQSGSSLLEALDVEACDGVEAVGVDVYRSATLVYLGGTITLDATSLAIGIRGQGDLHAEDLHVAVTAPSPRAMELNHTVATVERSWLEAYGTTESGGAVGVFLSIDASLHANRLRTLAEGPGTATALSIKLTSADHELVVTNSVLHATAPRFGNAVTLPQGDDGASVFLSHVNLLGDGTESASLVVVGAVPVNIENSVLVAPRALTGDGPVQLSGAYIDSDCVRFESSCRTADLATCTDCDSWSAVAQGDTSRPASPLLSPLTAPGMIDAALPSAHPNAAEDVDGTPRPQGVAPDLGAFEFH
jgi:hypothetical protein